MSEGRRVYAVGNTARGELVVFSACVERVTPLYVFIDRLKTDPPGGANAFNYAARLDLGGVSWTPCQAVRTYLAENRRARSKAEERLAELLLRGEEAEKLLCEVEAGPALRDTGENS